MDGTRNVCVFMAFSIDLQMDRRIVLDWSESRNVNIKCLPLHAILFYCAKVVVLYSLGSLSVFCGTGPDTEWK